MTDEPAQDVATSNVPAVRESQANIDEDILPYDSLPPELAEALRTIINRYELMHEGLLPVTVATTAAMRGEGVTTVSQALATVIAQEIGKYVCWVDCSWLSPDGRPGQADRPGLIDILADRANILSAFQTVPGVAQLFTLRAGPLPDSKRNLIARSPQFDRLLDVLTHEFDHVIFDVPSILTHANGLGLLRRADASLLVVRHRATTVTQFRRLVEATSPTPNLGVVLNRFQPSMPRGIRRLLGD